MKGFQISSKIKRKATATAKIVISAVALYFVFNRIHISEVLLVAGKANLFMLILALAAFVASKWVSSIRLRVFFRAAGIRISTRINHKLYLLGMYYNLFLPGGIGGDGYKVYLLNRRLGAKTGSLIKALLLDRLSGLLALVALALMLSSALPLAFFWKSLLVPGVVPIILVARWIVVRWFPDFASIFVRTGLQSLGVQLFQLVCVLFILMSLGIYRNIPEYMFVFLVSSIVATIPFTIGGIGAREITFLLGSDWLGLDAASSVALSLLFYLLTVFVSLAGVYFVFYPIDFQKILAEVDST